MHTSERSILIIEDNPDDGLLALRALKKLNFSNITLVETGPEALEHLYGQGKSPLTNTPDLILLDLNLPVIDGFSVLEKIRSDKATRKTPVIVLTSSGEESDIEKSYDLGANSYIQKPVDFLEFEKAALLISEYWLKLNVAPERHN
jgi:two-component system, response regulator